MSDEHAQLGLTEDQAGNLAGRYLGRPDAPTVGRIVHYVSHGSPIQADGTQKYRSVCRAAVVTRVHLTEHPPRVSLAVLNPTGLFFDLDVLEDDTAATGGTWHWPERQ